MVPGVFHCRGGGGPDRFDAMTPLIHWVEKGVAPDHLIGTQAAEAEITRTRRLCPYPQVARYDGKGDPDEAESFHCVDPS